MCTYVCMHISCEDFFYFLGDECFHIAFVLLDWVIRRSDKELRFLFFWGFFLCFIALFLISSTTSASYLRTWVLCLATVGWVGSCSAQQPAWRARKGLCLWMLPCNKLLMGWFFKWVLMPADGNILSWWVSGQWLLSCVCWGRQRLQEPRAILWFIHPAASWRIRRCH